MSTSGGVLLRNPQLGVSTPKTSDDEAALELMRKLISDVNSAVELAIVEEEVEGKTTPWLRTSHSVFRGLDEIRGFEEQERLFLS